MTDEGDKLVSRRVHIDCHGVAKKHHRAGCLVAFIGSMLVAEVILCRRGDLSKGGRCAKGLALAVAERFTDESKKTGT